ncbi:hypothetical protein HELRODRAFT_131517, partial [Helobdella robusta]|uniref:Fibronectin type-III domain-containing protein n=1 Tax=Helobdella robusta TaxID=6412 RepID=T1EHW0_HELRO
WKIISGTVKELYFKVTSLKDGQSYEFRVSAVNKVGQGQPSAPSVPAKYSPPGPPSAPEVSNILPTSCTLQWTCPTDDGGSPVLGYHVERALVSDAPSGPLRWISVNKEIIPDTKLNVKDLVEDNKYVFRVTAENKVGRGQPSAPSQPMVAKNPFGKPGTPEMKESTKSSIALTWTPPTDDGGSEITNYVIEMKLEDSVRWEKATNDKIKDTFYVVKGLKADKMYDFRVAAENTAGVGPFAETEQPIQTEDKIVPPSLSSDKPLNEPLVFNAGSQLGVELKFTGSPTPSIKWLLSEEPLNGSLFTVTQDTTSLLAKKCSVKVAGVYRVQAINEVGEAEMSFEIVVLDKPSAPLNLQVKKATSESAVVTWDEPESNGGSGILKYIVEKREASKSSWVTVSSFSKETMQATVDKLYEGNQYFFRVSAENKIGVGPAAETNQPYVGGHGFVPPGKPRNLNADEVTNKSCLLKWAVPESDGGSPISGYHIELLQQGGHGGKWMRITKSPVADLQHRVTDLSDKASYLFRVIAVNKAGPGEPS